MPRRVGRRLVGPLLIALAVLAAANVAHKIGPPEAGLILGPVVAAGLIILARRQGLSWDELGLGRGSWATGARYAAVLIAVVAAGYALAAAVPVTRPAFLDARYDMGTGAALVTAFLVIPVGTVLLEEVAFRGVLPGLVTRRYGMWYAVGFSSLLFGLWHILPSLSLGRANPAVTGAVGQGGGTQLLVVCAAVVFTAAAGVLLCELRRRSGSLLAPAGLHWAVNALGVLVGVLLRATGQH